VLSYPSGMTVSNRALIMLADLLRAHRTQLRSRWRRLDAGQQALLTVAHLRKGETYADLACGFAIGTSTVYRYLRSPRVARGDGTHAGRGHRRRPRQGVRDPRRHPAADRPRRYDRRSGLEMQTEFVVGARQPGRQRVGADRAASVGMRRSQPTANTYPAGGPPTRRAAHGRHRRPRRRSATAPQPRPPPSSPGPGSSACRVGPVRRRARRSSSSSCAADQQQREHELARPATGLDPGGSCRPG
jgi:hypothetical protein